MLEHSAMKTVLYFALLLVAVATTRKLYTILQTRLQGKIRSFNPPLTIFQKATGAMFETK